jgi:hypothetical protein
VEAKAMCDAEMLRPAKSRFGMLFEKQALSGMS